MKKNKDGIAIVNRKELQLIKDRMDEKKVQKGILIMGKPGIGKTTILKKWIEDYNDSILKKYSHCSPYELGLKSAAFSKKWTSTNRMVSSYMSTGKIDRCVNIDDLGVEPIANHYGTTLDVVPFLIQSMYEGNMEFGYMTTNLNLEELTERYGERVVDRIKEKCYFFILDDTSFRQLPTADFINQELG